MGISPLADPVFRRLYVSQIFALLGSGLTSVGLALLAYEVAGNQTAAVLGTGLAIRMIAKIPIAPLAGAFAHLIPRRRLLVGLDMARAALVAIYPLVTEVWQIYLLIFFFSACEAVFNPVFQSAIPDIFRNESRYTKALSLSRVVIELETMAAPALAATILALSSFEALFILAGLCLAFSAGLILSSGLPAQAITSDPLYATWPKVSRGLRCYFASPSLRAIGMLYFAISAASSMVLVNSVVLVRDNLALPESQVALLLTATGIGAVLGSLAMPGLVRAFGDRRVILIGGASLAPLLALGAGLSSFNGYLVLWAGFGLATGIASTPVGRVVTRESQATDRTALFAAQYAVSHACWLVTFPLAGWSVTLFGLEAAFVTLAVVALIAGGAAHFIWRKSG